MFISSVFSCLDADFKARLPANPVNTLRAEGIEFPAWVKVKALENTGEQFYLVIPQKTDDLNEEQLSNVAGGYNPDCDPCLFGSSGLRCPLFIDYITAPESKKQMGAVYLQPCRERPEVNV